MAEDTQASVWKCAVCGKPDCNFKRVFSFGMPPRATDFPPARPVDVVNHPPHYTKHPSGVECIQITEHMNFNLGNAVKYLWRAGNKGAQVEDLKKARWYVDREISRLEAAT